jgi:hypothetical protein
MRVILKWYVCTVINIYDILWSIYHFHNVYRSPNIIRVIKSRRLGYAGHVVRMGEGRSAFKVLTVYIKETFRKS